jgi:hypothetical protein
MNIKCVNTVLGQNNPCVNFMATGTRISPTLYQIFHKNERGVLEANQAQFYALYCLKPITKTIYFLFDETDQ